jgi:hypothetical protein
MEKNPHKFYTYAYLRENKTPYYIGKGSNNRIYKRSKKCIKPPKDKSRIIFLKTNLTEEEAFKHEIYMISVFGRKDLGTGILHNKTDGGDGVSGLIHSEETKNKCRKSRLGYKEDFSHKKWRSEKISEGWKNIPDEKRLDIIKNSIETNTQRIEVELEGIRFKSINQAARWAMSKYFVSRNTAIRYIKEERDFSDKKQNWREYNGSYTSTKYGCCY